MIWHRHPRHTAHGTRPLPSRRSIWIPTLTSGALTFALATSCAVQPPSETFTVRNASSLALSEAPVVFAVGDLGWDGAGCSDSLGLVAIGADGKPAAGPRAHRVQCDDLDGDGLIDEVAARLNLPAASTTSFRLVAADPRASGEEGATQAFLLVKTGGAFVDGVYEENPAAEPGSDRYSPFPGGEIPSDHVQGSGWPLYEGPVWESDKVAYRLYLDARNRTDVFGKRVADLVMDTVRGDYHAVSDWGADVLKVGESLGIGSFAAVTSTGLQTVDNWETRTFEVVAQGPVRSVARLVWTGWKVDGRVLDATIDYEIMAGQFHTTQKVRVEGDTEGMRFATGVARHPAAEAPNAAFAHGATGVWTEGLQSDQKQGLVLGAIVADRHSPSYVTTDPLSHLITFSLLDGRAETLFHARWELDAEPTDDPAGFHERLHAVASLQTGTGTGTGSGLASRAHDASN